MSKQSLKRERESAVRIGVLFCLLILVGIGLAKLPVTAEADTDAGASASAVSNSSSAATLSESSTRASAASESNTSVVPASADTQTDTTSPIAKAMLGATLPAITEKTSQTQAAAVDADDTAASTIPLWVAQAVVGTPYTPLEFMNLPTDKQLALIKAANPDIPTANVTQTESMGKYTPPTAAAAPAPQTNQSSTAQILRSQQRLLADGTAVFDIGIQPTAAGVAVQQIDLYTYPTGWSSALSSLVPGDFTVTLPAGLSASDFKLAVLQQGSSTYLQATLSAAAMKMAQSASGCPVKLVTTGPAGNNQLPAVTFNLDLWQPAIQRAYGKLDLGQNLQMQYMFNSYFPWDGKETANTLINPDAADPNQNRRENFGTSNQQSIDIPNMNVVNLGKSVRMMGQFRDRGIASNSTFFIDGGWDEYQSQGGGDNASPGSFGSWHSSPLLIGMDGGAAQTLTGSLFDGSYSPNYAFDDTRHIQMYPDPNEPIDDIKTVHLDYTGYITDAAKIQALSPSIAASVSELIFKVQCTLQPSPESNQMQMSETVTNMTPGVDLTGMYFVRNVDTSLAQKTNDTTPLLYSTAGTSNYNDNIPIRYAPIAQEGPLKGYTEGLYIRPEGDNPDVPYAIEYNFNNDHGPDGWFGGHDVPWGRATGAKDPTSAQLTGTSVAYNGAKTRYKSFTNTKSNGDAKNPANTPGSSASGVNGDTGIAMKWSSNYVGNFDYGKSVTMVYNGKVTDSAAPYITVDKHTMTVNPTDTGDVPVTGQAMDTDSDAMQIFYTVDDPVDVSQDIATLRGQGTQFASVSYTQAGKPKGDWLPFTGTISKTEAKANWDKLHTDGEHTIRVYAFDVPTGNQTAHVSNLETIRVNPRAKAVLHFVDENEDAVHAPVTKNGISGKAYDFWDFDAKSVLATAATDLTGQPPANLGDGPYYTLDTAAKPANATGVLPDDNGTVNIYFTYKKTDLQLTVPKLDFGNQTLPGATTQSYSNTLANTFTVSDTRSAKSAKLTLSAALTGFANGTGQDAALLNGASIRFTRNKSGVDVPCGTSATASGTNTDIASGLSGTTNPYDVNFDDIQLILPSATASTAKVGSYNATLTYTLSDGL